MASSIIFNLSLEPWLSVGFTVGPFATAVVTLLVLVNQVETQKSVAIDCDRETHNICSDEAAYIVRSYSRNGVKDCANNDDEKNCYSLTDCT